MHPEAFCWLAATAQRLELVGDAIEFGSRNINGSARDAIPSTSWWGIDLAAGDGVDLVADATVWVPDRTADFVVCAETFEHTPAWAALVVTAAQVLRPWGVFLVTCATEPRAPHCATGGDLPAGEWYRNVAPDDLRAAFDPGVWEDPTIEIHHDRGDLYLAARKITHLGAPADG